MHEVDFHTLLDLRVPMTVPVETSLVHVSRLAVKFAGMAGVQFEQEWVDGVGQVRFLDEPGYLVIEKMD